MAEDTTKIENKADGKKKEVKDQAEEKPKTDKSGMPVNESGGGFGG